MTEDHTPPGTEPEHDPTDLDPVAAHRAAMHDATNGTLTTTGNVKAHRTALGRRYSR